MISPEFRSHFPFFRSEYTYLDNAATTQKPQAVIDAMSNFYAHEYASVGRGIYKLAEQATARYEAVRAQTARFFNAAHASEIIFTPGATYGINIVAQAWARNHLKPGDEIVLTELEHHANLVPWQIIAQQTGAVLKFIPVTSTGDLDYDAITRVITKKTKLVCLTHSSNAIGTLVDVARIIPHARAVGARVLIDGVQSAPHMHIDLQKLDCDFFVAAPHKMLGPTGLGVLYIRRELQEEVAPYLYGGGMVFEADYEKTTLLPSPQKFYGGTPPIAEVIGYGAALTFYEEHIDFDALKSHESVLMRRLITGLSALKNVCMYGPLEQLQHSGHLVTFTVDGVHCHDVAAYLDTYNICVRSGHYCAQALAKKLGIDCSARVSIFAYTTIDEIDYFLNKIDSLK
jgi:cysteine desulfurase/selenocysteine lyase